MANKAAWITDVKARPFKVDDAPMPVPSTTEIVVRNHAVAINPVDWAVQSFGMFPIPYPTILGLDAAGEITAIGPLVKNLRVGDRVVTSLDPFAQKDSRRGAFQLFSLGREEGTAKIPESVSYSEAAVLPLAVSTSASALFQADRLGLQLPSSNTTPTGKVVLIWGGATSLGACAIQLVIAAGYDVATTASSRNLDTMRALGAKFAYDYTKDGVVDDIVNDLKHLDFAGAYCAVLAPESITQCAQIAIKLDGKKFVQTVVGLERPFPDGLPDGVEYSKGKNSGSLDIFCSRFQTTDMDTVVSLWHIPARERSWPCYLGKVYNRSFSSWNLQVCATSLIFGEGLEAIQGATDRWKQGVSYQKVVVELP